MKFSRWILITGTLFLICALIFSGNLSVSAVNLDGNPGPAEWKGSTEKLMFRNENESNCAVYWAHLRILESPSTDEIFVALMVSDSKFNDNFYNEESPYYTENSPVAVRINLNGTELQIGLNGEPEYNREPYHVSSKFLVNESLNGYTVEIRIGVKLDFYSKNTYGLRLVDSVGEPSSLYSITIDNTPVPTTAQNPIVTTTEKPVTTKKPAAEKTTASKTYSASTTRRWTVTKKEKTTVPKTAESSTMAEVAETSAKAVKTVKTKTSGEATTQEYAADINVTQTETWPTEMATKYIIISSKAENDDPGQMKTSHKIVLAICIATVILFALCGYFLQKKNKTTEAEQEAANSDETGDENE